MNFIVVLVILLFHIDLISSPDIRSNYKNIYLSPEDKISRDVYNSIMSSNSPDTVDTSIQSIQKALEDYHSQFSEEKRILEEKVRGERLGAFQSVNLRRLIVEQIQSNYTDSHIIRESETLFGLYKKLGDLYSQKANKNVYFRSTAIEAYLSALRFRDFSQSEEKFLDPESFQYSRDEEFLEKRKAHQQAKKEYEDSLANYEEESKKLYRELQQLASEFQKNDEPPYDKISARRKEGMQRLEELKKAISQKLENYNQSKKENYEKWLFKKRKEDSEILVSLAHKVKEVEDEIKSTFRIERQSTLYGENPHIVFDSTKNNKFFAYRGWLELAHRIYSQNPNTILLLAEETKASGEYSLSIEYYEKFLALLNDKSIDWSIDSSAKDRTDPSNNIANAHLALAVQYSILKNYIPSAFHYEKYLEKENDENKKQAYYYVIAKLYSANIGSLEKANIYYKKWLELSKAKTIDPKQNLTDYLDWNKKVFDSNYALFEYDLQIRKPVSQLIRAMNDKEDIRSEPIDSLLPIERAYLSFLDLQKLLKEEEENEAKLRLDYENWKKKLLYKTNDDDYSQLVISEKKWNEAKERVNIILAKYNILPKSKLLFKIAELLETRKNLDYAKKVYYNITTIGNPQEVECAYKNITRIQQVLSDGIYRGIIHP